MSDCGACTKQFCSNCGETNWLECCQEYRCSSCMTHPRQCLACSVNVCATHAEECHACAELLCNNCCSKHCGTCCKLFCGDDCAFINHCDQFNTSYCESCEVVVRCPSCGKACCEKCRGQGGCCEMCDEKPAKKARLSR